MTMTYILPIKGLTGLILGLGIGFAIPCAVKEIIRMKNKKRGLMEMPEVLEKKWIRAVVAVADAILTIAAWLTMEPAIAGVVTILIQIAIISVFVDHYINIIANEAVVVLFVVGIVYRILAGGFSSLLGSLEALGVVIVLFGGLAAVFLKVVGVPGVGAGDLKYAMVIAIAVGWPGVFYFLAGMAAALLVHCFIGVKFRNMVMRSGFPMCLQLSIGLLAALFLPAISGLSAMGG